MGLFRLAAFALATSALTPMCAAAQATTSAGGEVEEVVVTGSNVIRNGYQAPTPVTAIQAEQLAAAAPGRLGDAITQLPQFRGSPSSKTAYQPTLGLGGSTLSLRNLGSNRTLVLVDGRRIVPNSTRGDFDIDLIPSAIVQRVDIVTGGASAQYGSDAVGGAVNLILDRQFTGFKGLIQGGVSKYNDGGSWKLELTHGMKFADDRGHLILSYAHNDFDEIESQKMRPWGAANYGVVSVAGAKPRVQILPGIDQVASYGGAVIAGPLAGTQFLPGSVWAPFDLGSPRTASAAVNSDGTNLVQPIQSGFRGDTIYARASFDVTDSVGVYGEAAVVKGKSFFTQGYPTFNLGATPITIVSGNPYLPADLQARMTAQNIASFQIHRVNQDLGMTFSDLDNLTVNLTGGVDARFGGWDVQAYASYGKNDGDYIVLNNVDLERYYAASDAVRDPASGQTVCRVSLTNPGLYPGCAPLNLLGDGSPSQAATDYVVRDMPFTTLIEQKVASLQVRGEPFSTWAGPVALGFGGQWREQSLDQTVDPVSSYTMAGTGIRGFPSGLVNRLGGLSSLNPQPASGSVTVKEAYAEVLVPLAKDLPWVQSLDLNAAARYTHYSTSGGVTTWKIGATYQPVDDLRFRGTYSKDIRAPNLGELYASGTSSQSQINDPTQGRRSYIVYSKGVPNPNLDPEEGKTYAVGAVYSPSWLPGLSASIDYFNISIEGLITTLTNQQTVDACFAGSQSNCAAITRGGPTNDVLVILIPNQNLAALETEGVDVDVSYSRELAGGRLSLRAFGSYVPTWIMQAPGAPPVNYAGEIQQRGSLAYANPRFTANLTLAYDNGPWSAVIQQRFIGRGTYDVTLRDDEINNNDVPSVSYMDLTAKYRFQALGAEQEAFITINNLWDKSPPLFPVGSSILPSYYNRALYDGVGRYFTVGLRVRM